MTKTDDDKIKWLILWELLRTETDEEHPLSTNEIVRHLDEKGYMVNRKTIPKAINQMVDNGFEVMTIKKKESFFYVPDRGFDIAELRVLLDAVQASSFITDKKTKELMGKISALAGKNKAKLLQNSATQIETVKHSNEKIYYSVDILNDCIEKKKKVSFQCFDYGLKGERIYRKDGGKFVVNPIALVVSEDKYYLVCYNDKYGNLINYRVDRLDKVEPCQEDMSPCDDVSNYSIVKHKERAFSMYTGELRDVEMDVNSECINPIVDKLGEKVNMMLLDNGRVRVKAKLQISPTFYGWCFTLAGKLTIHSPQDIADEYKRLAAAIARD